MPSRILARLAAAAMTLGLLAGAAAAQDKWPSRPVTVIVPFAAGGNTDVMARIFSDQLTKRLGQQFVVENRPGAGGVNGLQALTRAAPDGYTVAVATSGGIAINPVLMKDKIPYNVEKDFTYLYGMAAQPNIWLVHPSVPANTMAELIAWLKANPDTPYATSGPGSDAASLRRNAGARRRPQDDAGLLPRLQSQHPGSDRRPDQARLRQLRGGLRTGEGRQGCAPSRSPRPSPIRSPGRSRPRPRPCRASKWCRQFGWVGPANMPPDIVKKLTEELVAVGKIPEVRVRAGKVRRAADGAAGARLRRCAQEGA